MPWKQYGERIRQLRLMRGYSQEYMAQRLGLSGQKQYSRYESGETKLDLARLEAILHVLGATLADLLSPDGPPGASHAQQPIAAMDAAHAEERAVLHARITHLEGEVEYLRQQLARALSGR